MTLHLGKLERAAMERAVYRSLGKDSTHLLTGPARGLDNAVVSVGTGKRMLVTADPVSIIPSVGMAMSAWLSVHLIASDYTTSGLKPQFATFTYNLPREMRGRDAEDYLRAIGRECAKLGIAIVAGHTGSYPGGGFTVVGGGTMFGFCNEGDYVDPTMAKAGDAILMTKGAAIEAAATLAQSFPKYLERVAGRVVCNRAKMMLSECSTVEDALIASSCGLGPGGVTSMHDATEGGILGALAEMADASRHAFFLEKSSVNVAKETLAVCSAFELDPLATVSEGALILTVSPESADQVQKRLHRSGIAARQIGTVKPGRDLWVAGLKGGARKMKPPVDRFWSAYRRGIRSRLK